MRRLPILVLGLCSLVALDAGAARAAVSSRDTALKQLFDGETPEITRFDPNEQQVFVAPAPGLSKAVLDTVYLYGGPGTVQGKFQQILGGNGGLPDPQGWFGVDRTDTPTYWNISSFNADNFTGPIDNHAYWSGVGAGAPGFVSAPGYGNNWDDRLIFERTVNAGSAHTARLTFQYNYDTEPGYDFFSVSYDSAGSWRTLLSVSGTNDDGSGTFPTPADFDQTVAFPVGALSNGKIRLRIRFQSDSAASDEDPFFDSIGGACQVDNIRVFIDNVQVSFADYEGSPGDADWVVDKAPFVGDFSKLFTLFQDLDPCAMNDTPQWGFLDNGTPPNNSTISTGGQVSTNWNYGVAGGWVTNFTGGVSFGELELWNEVWSPEIDWDLPGTDDDAAVGGALLRFSIWSHLPLRNGMFYLWSVRSYPDANGNWSGWGNRNLVTYEDLPTYANEFQQVVDLLVSNPQKVQIALAAIELADVFGLPGDDCTPAPLFDNVSFTRYRVGGPSINSVNFQRFQDAFPQSGASNLSDLAALAIRLDAPNEISGGQGPNIVPADSSVINIAAVVPGTIINQPPVLRFVLDANPLFDGVRTLPAGSSVQSTFTGRDGRTWNRWVGAITGQPSTNASGSVVAGRYWFDFPDGPKRSLVAESDEPAMFFPGDELRFFYESTDSGGNVTTSPAGLTDPATYQSWLDGSWGIVGRGWTVKGLPSLYDADSNGIAEQPSILMINDFGRRGGENDFLQAFNQNGLQEGVDFDTYTVMDPDGAQGNGIGTAGSYGANAQQLAGYRVIFYDSGDLTLGLGDGNVDKSNDVEVLSQWHDLPGDRFVAYFGDYVASSLANGTPDAIGYLQSKMGVDYVSIDVRGDIANQTTPVVVPDPSFGSAFTTEFVAYGGCLGINEFDNIQPIASAQRLHQYATPSGGLNAYTAAASVWYDRTINTGIDTYRRVNVTFPYGMNVLFEAANNRAPAGSSARARLFAELLTAFGEPINDGGATSTTPLVKSALLGNVPNPFNPATSIQLRVGAVGKYSLRVYNLRGELVRTLVSGELPAGTRSVVWDGTDDAGRAVSSGVYLTRFVGPDVSDSAKLMLLK